MDSLGNSWSWGASAASVKWAIEFAAFFLSKAKLSFFGWTSSVVVLSWGFLTHSQVLMISAAVVQLFVVGVYYLTFRIKVRHMIEQREFEKSESKRQPKKLSKGKE